MATPKKTNPKFDREPLQFTDMTQKQQRAAGSIVGDFGETLPATMRKRAEGLRGQATRAKESTAKTQLAKAARLEATADITPSRRMTLKKASDNRVAAVEAAASPENRTSTEHSLAGAGWYFDAHRQVAEHAPNHPHDVAIAASSAMSPGTTPDAERAALRALSDAHASDAKVHMHPALAASLREQGTPVPEHMVGRNHSIHEIPADMLAAMSAPEHRALVQTHARDIDFQSIGKVSSPDNVTKATNILRGVTPVDQAQSPATAPKTWSYTQNHRIAVPNTPEHQEYQLRAAHLGAAIRGEVHGSQQMVDYHDLRHSNEGILSNKGHTAEDSWMQSISVGIPDRSVMKAGGDVQPTAKTARIGDERVSASPDARHGASAVYHAWNNAATHQAAKTLQDKHNTEFTVPSTLVQETAWTSTRRMAGADPEFNAEVRDKAQADKPAGRSASFKQGTLF